MAYNHQVGGHRRRYQYTYSWIEWFCLSFKCECIEILPVALTGDGEGFVLKSNVTQNEINFYQRMENTEDHSLLELKQFTPGFGGIIVDENDTSKTHNF